MITKVYELRKKYAAYFETKYCGVVVPMSFTIGAGSTGENRAELVVTDRFTQDAIENDPRFGRAFVLAATYGEPDPEPVEETPAVTETKPKRASRQRKSTAEAKEFKTLNDAIYYLEEELGVETNDNNIESLMQQYNISVKA